MTRPIGAKPILEMRLNGQRPAMPVLVSLVGRLPSFDGPLVIADPEVAYDWTFLAGLETHVWLREGVGARRTLLALASHDAALLQVWDVDLQQGAWVMVDTPAADARMEAALEKRSLRLIRSAWQKRYEGGGVEVWLAPWGEIMNEEYARGAAHLEVPCKP